MTASASYGKFLRYERMSKHYQVNERIRAKELRVITHTGENLGVMTTSDALKKAKEAELDLVIITEGSTPPIAKILDFNKFLYEENKKLSASKAKSKKSELKEFRVRPNIGEGDLNVRIERAKEFLADGNRVLLTVQLKGRERAFPEVAFEKAEKFTKGLEGHGRAEGEPKMVGPEVKVIFVKK